MNTKTDGISSGLVAVAWVPDDAIAKLRSGEPKILLTGVPMLKYEGVNTSGVVVISDAEAIISDLQNLVVAENQRKQQLEAQVEKLTEENTRLTGCVEELTRKYQEHAGAKYALQDDVEKLTKERDRLRDQVELGVLILEKRRELEQQLTALAEQNAKMREVLSEAKTMVGHPDNIAIIDTAISLPDLATPALNKYRAEGMRMAAEICKEMCAFDHPVIDAIHAKADELENSND